MVQGGQVDCAYCRMPPRQAAVCSSCSVVGPLWKAGISYMCAFRVVSCSSFCLPMHSQPSHLFVTHLSLPIHSVYCTAQHCSDDIETCQGSYMCAVDDSLRRAATDRLWGMIAAWQSMQTQGPFSAAPWSDCVQGPPTLIRLSIYWHHMSCTYAPVSYTDTRDTNLDGCIWNRSTNKQHFCAVCIRLPTSYLCPAQPV